MKEHEVPKLTCTCRKVVKFVNAKLDHYQNEECGCTSIADQRQNLDIEKGLHDFDRKAISGSEQTLEPTSIQSRPM